MSGNERQQSANDKIWEEIEKESEKSLSPEDKELLDRIKRATPKEIDKSLVDAGVYTPDGRLTKKYGGDA